MEVMCEVPEECTFAANSGFANDCGENSNCYYQTLWTQPMLPQLQQSQQTFSMQSSVPEIKVEPLYSPSFLSNGGSESFWPCQNLPMAKAPVRNCASQNCSVQKLSYLPHCYAACSQQQENRFSYAMTEQGLSPQNVCRPVSPLECCTINKLSYLPVNVCLNPPPKSLAPAYRDAPWATYC